MHTIDRDVKRRAIMITDDLAKWHEVVARVLDTQGRPPYLSMFYCSVYYCIQVKNYFGSRAYTHNSAISAAQCFAMDRVVKCRAVNVNRQPGMTGMTGMNVRNVSHLTCHMLHYRRCVDSEMATKISCTCMIYVLCSRSHSPVAAAQGSAFFSFIV